MMNTHNVLPSPRWSNVDHRSIGVDEQLPYNARLVKETHVERKGGHEENDIPNR